MEVLIEAVRRIRLSEPDLAPPDVCSRANASGIACNLSEVKKALSKATKAANRSTPSARSARSEAGDSHASRASTARAALAAHASTARARMCATQPKDSAADSALADAVEMHDSATAAWMRSNGVRTPTASEAARLRRLAERLQEQKSLGDLDGAVETWLEFQPVGGARARPTKQERKLARRKMSSFFAGDDPTVEALAALLPQRQT